MVNIVYCRSGAEAKEFHVRWEDETVATLALEILDCLAAEKRVHEISAELGKKHSSITVNFLAGSRVDKIRIHRIEEVPVMTPAGAIESMLLALR